MDREDAVMIFKVTSILGGIFALLMMLSQAAQARGDDGILSYKQCLKVMNMHGSPCVHKTPFFVTFGIGKTPVSGKQKSNPPRTVGGNNGFASTQMEGARYYVAKKKTRYAMDGTPSQCTDPCAPCKSSNQCKYHVGGDGTFRWYDAHGFSTQP